MRSFLRFDWENLANDPDNWLEIPDFGVRPAEVSFEGFEYQIMDPSAFFPRQGILEAVRAVRVEAKRRFKSLADLRSFYERALETNHFTGYPEDCSSAAFAIRYQLFIGDMKLAVHDFKSEPYRAFGAVAAGMGWLTEMLTEKQFDEEALKVARSSLARIAAEKRHVDTYNIKASVFDWLAKNRAVYRSKDKAAEGFMAARIAPIAFRTVRSYVGEFDKMQSAGKL